MHTSFTDTKFSTREHISQKNPKDEMRTLNQVRNEKTFEFTLQNETAQCCNNKSIYEIIYNLGTKWLVCNECLEIECFNSDIKEKVRIIH